MKCFISSIFFSSMLIFYTYFFCFIVLYWWSCFLSLITNIDVIRHSCFCVAPRLSSAPRSCGNGDAVLNQEGNGRILLYTYTLIRRRFLNCVDYQYNAEQEFKCGVRIFKNEAFLAYFRVMSYSFSTYAE
jgi:hypothetical protein